MLGNLNQKQIEEVLKNQIIAHIGCHADGKTYVVPISYAYDGTYVYVHTFEGLKVTLMRKNPSVCFQVDEMKDMANWKSVVAWGQFEEITEEEERANAIEVLASRTLPMISSVTTHLSKIWPFLPEDLSNITGIIFRIRLEEKTGKCENNKDISADIHFG